MLKRAAAEVMPPSSPVRTDMCADIYVDMCMDMRIDTCPDTCMESEQIWV